MQRVRVGRIPDELPVQGLSEVEFRLLGVWRRWVDAVVFDPPRVILIEGAVLPDPGDVSQLELYLRLFPQTPEFADFRTAPLEGHLVYGVDDPTIRGLARERGMTVHIFQPSWLGSYLLTRLPGHRRPPLPQN
jgi:hypothetical protein